MLATTTRKAETPPQSTKILRALRALTGLRQDRFARECGLSHAVYSRIESGVRRPNPEELQRIFQVVAGERQ